MPTKTVPGDATPAATQDAEQGSEVESLDALTAFIAQNEARPTETAGELKPAEVEAEDAPSQLETASDGAAAEATPATDEPAAEAGAEEQAEPPEDPPATEPEGDDALEEWLATLPKGAARKLRAQHRQISELKRELADTKAKQPEGEVKARPSAPVVINNQLDHISDLRELETVEAKSRDTLRSAERALDAVDDLRDALDTDPEQVVRQLKAAKYEPPEDREGLVKFIGDLKRNIRAERAKATDSLDALPRRRAHLEREAQVIELAAPDYPWLRDKQGDDYQLFQQMVQARPQVKLLGPDWAFMVAVQVEGYKSLQARRAAKAKAAPVMAKAAAAAAPPKQPSRSAAPTRAAPGSAARSRFEQTGSVEDLAEAIAATL